MSSTATTIFSDFEVSKLGLKMSGDSAATVMSAVGSAEESRNSRTITKKERGMVAKERVKGTGSGELKLSLHLPFQELMKIQGMDISGLTTGVYAYGQGSKHPALCVTAEVLDEDDNKKLMAWPNAVLKEAVGRKIKNGDSDVAEVEMTISYLPDTYGNGVYESLSDDLDETTEGTWMSAFTPASVHSGS